MGKPITYSVSFTPATVRDGMISMSISLMAAAKRHPVVASSLEDLECEVRRLASEFGQTCAPFIDVPKGTRKPAGFDKWRDRLRYIEVEPQETAA